MEDTSVRASPDPRDWDGARLAHQRRLVELIERATHGYDALLAIAAAATWPSEGNLEGGCTRPYID